MHSHQSKGDSAVLEKAGCMTGRKMQFGEAHGRFSSSGLHVAFSSLTHYF